MGCDYIYDEEHRSGDIFTRYIPPIVRASGAHVGRALFNKAQLDNRRKFNGGGAYINQQQLSVQGWQTHPQLCPSVLALTRA